MDKRKLLKYIVFLMFVIFLANNIALKFYWYYSISWFDMLMHFLGGLWVGLFFSYIFYDKNPFFKQLLTVILCVLSVGILWEIFEFFIGAIAHDPFSIRDTTSDIFFDLAGGLFAIFYCLKKTMPAKSSIV